MFGITILRYFEGIFIISSFKSAVQRKTILQAKNRPQNAQLNHTSQEKLVMTPEICMTGVSATNSEAGKVVGGPDSLDGIAREGIQYPQRNGEGGRNHHLQN